MKNKLLMTMVVPFLFSGQASAADFSKISQVSVILNLVIFIGAIACLAIALKLFKAVKGGALAKGCQLWVVSFIVLATGQVFTLADKFEIFALNFDIAAVLYSGTVILWFAGLVQTRKVLG
ncbi:MAG: hypothetical protein KAR42_01850 [candidate division Zixibacteria bacterium]|nr:hypothetical protein [candidate division Zixibacteria bacterium]